MTINRVALMARAEGGWGAFLAPFLAHSQRHFSRLVANPGGFPELGLVKGLGGVLPAGLVVIGDGPEKDEVRHLAAELGIAGRVEGRDGPALGIFAEFGRHLGEAVKAVC